MLFWHKHNIERALSDLPNFTPFPDEWSVEDKVLFEQAFGFHGKSFHRIKQMVSPCNYMMSLLIVLFLCFTWFLLDQLLHTDVCAKFIMSLPNLLILWVSQRKYLVLTSLQLLKSKIQISA